MRTRDHDINDIRAEQAFRQTLANLGEPAELSPPPDLVTRTMRQIPKATPAVVARQRQLAFIIRLSGAVLLLLFVGFFGWAMMTGGLIDQPRMALLHLALKPIIAALELYGVALLLIGVVASAMSLLLLKGHVRQAGLTEMT